MKRFLTLFLLFTLCLPVFAVNWQQYTYKGWYDISSWERNNNKVIVWFKDLNPGNWELKNNKKVWYTMTQYEADCGMRKIRLLSLTLYGLKGEVLDTYDPTTYKKYDYGKGFYTEQIWQNVVPESIGEAKYYTMCNLR